jgi:hypothetical protein
MRNLELETSCIVGVPAARKARPVVAFSLLVVLLGRAVLIVEGDDPLGWCEIQPHGWERGKPIRIFLLSVEP